MNIVKETTALSIIGDLTMREMKELLEVSAFPVVVIDSAARLKGIIDETAFWKHVALHGWETKVIQAVKTNYRLIQNESELLSNAGTAEPPVEYYVLRDENYEFKVYGTEEVKEYSLRQQYDSLKNFYVAYQEELKILRQQNAQLKLILDSSYDEIFVSDSNGDVLFVSESSQRFVGFPPEMFVGKNIRELIKKGLVENSVTMQVLKTRSIVSHQQTYINGKTLLVTGKPVFHENGDLHLIIINSRDITELVELSNQIAYANSLIDRQNKFLLERQSNPLFAKMNTRSEKMLPILELIEKVAPTDSSILIEGESGVGKSALARIIHETSKRKEENFVQINCGAIPPTLIESELFGYESGSFTGANKKGKIGLVEQADGGTLFLDEIGELPLDLQVKLLQVVQDKSFIPVGGTKVKKVDIRIISATNKNLKQRIKEKLFREDLYYRLHVVQIVMPPLRERPEDISLLIDYFLQECNTKYEQSIQIDESTLPYLLGYEWSGNIRELENLIEKLVVTANESMIYPDDLPPHILEAQESKLPGVTVSGILPLNQAVEETERQIMKRAIQKYKTSRKIAKALEVNQTTVIRKIHKYNLQLENI